MGKRVEAIYSKLSTTLGREAWEEAIRFGNLLNPQSILFSKYQGNPESFSLHVLIVEICLDIGIQTGQLSHEGADAPRSIGRRRAHSYTRCRPQLQSKSSLSNDKEMQQAESVPTISSSAHSVIPCMPHGSELVNEQPKAREGGEGDS